jgi:CHAD domain-containing protein
MAYRLERDESVIAGLKRVVREEIDSAGTQLSGNRKATRDEAIHEARKSIKKVRALLRLVGAELGGDYPRENARLRDIGRRLSEFRDAFAIIATFDDLKRKYKGETLKKLRSVRTGLVKKRNEAGREEDVEIVLDHAAAALGKAARRVKAWPLKTNGYAAIGPGIAETYRAGRAALARAREDPRPEHYHELRKRVKDHWYHIRFLESLWTDVMSAYEKSLKDLETWLGNDHNLAVLRERIVAESAFYGQQKDIDLTLDLIDKYQKELRDQSLSLAERIYEEKPREFTRRMKHLWDTWRHEPKDLEEPPTAA